MTLLHHPRPNEPQLQAGIPPHDCWRHPVLKSERKWFLFICRVYEWEACEICGIPLTRKVEVR